MHLHLHVCRYGWSNDSIKLEIRSCVGNESFLLDCHHHLNPSGCSHMHDVNLVCSKYLKIIIIIHI